MKTMTLLVIVLLGVQCRGGEPVVVDAADRAVLERYLDHARRHDLAALPLARRIAETGRFFLGTPYRAGTLDDGGTERLVVNTREMDCVTFVDNVLALALLDPRDGENSLPRFLENLRRVRYRDGEIIDYSSRLHYSTDWLFEMRRQGILGELPLEGSIPFTGKVGYITRHPGAYPALANDPALVARVAAVEERVNAREQRHLPKERVEARAGQLREGDIVLVTTTRAGLDTAHLGIAVEVDGKIHLLHASSDARAVVITGEPLRDYLKHIRHHAGIIAGRPTR
jgi:hypothetical protein